MSKSIVWSTVAKRNIKEIKEFYDFRNRSPEYSRKLLRVLKKASHVIEAHPQIGKNTDLEGVKGFVILNYMIFYEILDSHILILMIWDCRRDPEQIKKLLKY